MNNILQFTIPLIPPTVNMYTRHTRQGRHYKTKLALAWEQAFAIYAPRDEWVTAKQFKVTLDVYLGPKDKLDVDNAPKMCLDCIARHRLLRNKSGRNVSDSYVKALAVFIWDSKKDRANGAHTDITVEAWK